VKIESVEAILAHTYCLVRIRTDSGLTGWGQTAYFSCPEAAERVVNRFGKYLVGKDPLQIERHWNYLFRSTPFRSSDQCGALSAVDMALWDIAGKHFEVPAYQLLGGKQRDKVRLHYLMAGSSMNTLEEIVQRAEHAVKEEFTALKLDPLPPGHQHLSFSALVEEVCKRLSAVREVIGSEMELGIEIHRKLVPSEAINLAQYLQPFRLLFLEDPIPPNSVDAQVQVTRNISIPVAYGERCLSIYDFRDLLTRDGVHYLRPDVGVAGGLTHYRKIAALGEAFHAGMIPHNFISPLLTAATTQADMAIPNCTMQEYCFWDEEPPNCELLKTPLKREGGYLIPPEAPGLGVEVNEEFMSKYPYRAGEPRTPLHRDGSVAVH